LRATEWTCPRVDPLREPIVALPGVLAPRISFRRLAHALLPEFRVIAVDFPGFGESEKPSPNRYPYGIPAFAESIADLFAGLELSRAHLLGHGLGGAVAIHLAAHHAELVRRMALISPLVYPRSRQGSYRALLAPVVGGLLLRQFLGRRTYGQIYRERVNPGLDSSEIDEYYEGLPPPASRAALLATLRASQDGRAVIADSRRVRSPSLLLWGREDRLLPVETGRYLSREMPSAGLEILESAHAPHEQCPEKTASTLARFFAGNRAGLG